MKLGVIKSHDRDSWNATALCLFNKKDIEYIGYKLEIDVYNVDEFEVRDIVIELSNRHILPKPCERDWYHVRTLENLGYKFPKDMLLIEVLEIKSLSKDMLQIEVQLKKLNQNDEKDQQYYITIPKQLTEAIGMEPDVGLSVYVDGGDIVLRREGGASIQQIIRQEGRMSNLEKKDEIYITRLLRYTFLKYYPVKEVVDAIVYSDYEPSEINGDNGSIFDIVLYLRYKGIQPSEEGKEEYDIKRMLAWDEKGMIETVKNHWDVL